MKDETDKDLLTLIQGLDRPSALDMCRSLIDGWLQEAGGGRLTPAMRRWTRIPNSSRRRVEYKQPLGLGVVPGPEWVDVDTSTDRLLLVTAMHQYSITVNPEYLGCIARSRIAAPGEDWLRGNDLHDGKFNRTTWDGILRDIFAYELVEIPTPPERWNSQVAMMVTADPVAAPLLSADHMPYEGDTMSHEDAKPEKPFRDEQVDGSAHLR